MAESKCQLSGCAGPHRMDHTHNTQVVYIGIVDIIPGREKGSYMNVCVCVFECCKFLFNFEVQWGHTF